MLYLGQNSHVWDYSAGTTKIELRGHENDVECAEFAPVVAYAAIRELTGKTVSTVDCALSS